MHALKACRVAILLVLAGLAFLLLASQGEDVARALAERRTNDRISSQAFWFFAAVLAWSLSAWYWARTMLFLRLPGVATDGRAHWVRIWTPRVLGFLAPLGVAAAFYKASRGYAMEEHPEVKQLLEFYGFWCAVGALVFLVAVTARRRLARAAYRSLKLEFLNLPHVHDENYAALHLRELGLLTRSILVGTILTSILLFDLMAALLVVSFYTSISGLIKAELFPMHVRALGVGLSYALANALFGGTAEYAALWFKSVGHESTFFWYVVGMGGVALIAVLLMPDTRHRGYLTADEGRHLEPDRA